MQPIIRKKSMRGAVVRLQPGDKLIMGADKTEVVRSLCSTLNFSMQRKYTTRIDRETQSIIVTRIY